MYSTEKACLERTRFATRREFEAAFDVYTDPEEMRSMIRTHFREHPPKPFSKKKPMVPSDHPYMAIRNALASPIYSNPCDPVDAVLTTFKYLFDRHKMGVYVSIRGNKLVRFSSFNNLKFRNPLAPLLTLSPTDRARVEASETHALNKDPSAWSALDCLVGNVARNRIPPPSEGYEPTYNFTETYTIVKMTCENRNVGDCDFFVNLWDQLLLRRDLCVPHLSITGGRLVPIREYQSRRDLRMCPIVSFCCADDYLDLPFVFPDDVQRATSSFFIPRCTNGFAEQEKHFVTKWSEKSHPCAVFRGTATGCGWTVETNPRMYAAALTAELLKRKSKGKAKAPPIVDARLVGVHLERFKKPIDSPYVHFFTDERVVPLQSDDNRLDLVQQSKYKYVLDLPGNVVAYRVAGMFGLGSVVIAVLHERYRPWMFPLMKPSGPDQNCILLTDATQLLPTVEWCRENDAECARIAARGLKLYNTMFRKKEALMDYVTLLMNSISQVSCGTPSQRPSAKKPPSRRPSG